MDPDYHSNSPGKCPRCGMTLVLHVPDRVEFPLELSQSPAILKPGDTANLTFRVLNPAGQAVRHFETVHEKLMHLFVVSENLKFFAHVHPVIQPDGSFQLPIRLPYGGMYRLLADYYPSGSVPQLAVDTLYVTGASGRAHLAPALAAQKSAKSRRDVASRSSAAAGRIRIKASVRSEAAGRSGALPWGMGAYAGGQ